MNKMLLLSIIGISFTYLTLTYPMEKHTEAISIGIQDKKTLSNKTQTFNMSWQDASHSLHISTAYENSIMESWSQYPPQIECQKKELKFFTKLLHRPGIYSTLKWDKYYKGLALAEKLQAPLLYANLIDERLAEPIPTLIKQYYLRSYQIQHIIYCDSSYLCCREEQLELYKLMKTSTLTQGIILMLLCNKKPNSTKKITIEPHMAGFKAITSWNDENWQFITKIFNIVPQYTTKKNKNFIQSLSFTV